MFERVRHATQHRREKSKSHSSSALTQTVQQLSSTELILEIQQVTQLQQLLRDEEHLCSSFAGDDDELAEIGDVRQQGGHFVVITVNFLVVIALLSPEEDALGVARFAVLRQNLERVVRHSVFQARVLGQVFQNDSRNLRSDCWKLLDVQSLQKRHRRSTTGWQPLLQHHLLAGSSHHLGTILQSLVEQMRTVTDRDISNAHLVAEDLEHRVTHFFTGVSNANDQIHVGCLRDRNTVHCCLAHIPAQRMKRRACEQDDIME